MFTAFDRSLFWRTLGIAGVLLGVAVAVVALTDEAGSTWALRLARLAAMAPALASLGGIVILEQARFRGDLRALAALGVSPWKAARGAAFAGWCLGLFGACALALGWADPASLFPVLPEPGAWQARHGGLMDLIHGVLVKPDGTIVFVAPVGAAIRFSPPGPWAAALAVGCMGSVVPYWTATPLRLGWRLGGFAVTLAAMVALFHARAAGVISTPWLCLGSAPLLLQAGYARCRLRPG